jgi:hypothetical protein
MQAIYEQGRERYPPANAGESCGHTDVPGRSPSLCRRIRRYTNPTHDKRASRPDVASRRAEWGPAVPVACNRVAMGTNAQEMMTPNSIPVVILGGYERSIPTPSPSPRLEAIATMQAHAGVPRDLAARYITRPRRGLPP